MSGGNNTVGKGNYTPGVIAKPTPTPTQTSQLKPGNVSAIDSVLGTKLPGIKIIPAIQYDQMESLSDADILALGQVLDKLGYTVKNSKANIKYILSEDPIISSIVKNNLPGGFFSIRDALLRDYTPVNTKAAAENLPARTISKVDPVVFGEVINSVFQKVAMKKGTPEQINALVKEYLPKMETGTLTETKKVKNPQTGKLESVTTVTPGMSQANAETSIEQRIKELYPNEVDRTARINFDSWLTKNSRGV